MTGSAAEAAMPTLFPQADIQTFDGAMDAIAALKAGKVDAAVTIYTNAVQILKKNPDLKLLPEVLHQQDSAMAVRKGDTALLQSLNKVVADMTADGTLKDMRRRWIKLDSEPYETVVIPMSSTGVPLRVGVNAAQEPTCFVSADSQISGHDGEFIRRVGAKLGRPIEFLDMKFMALIPALKAGKIDVISGLFITPERARSVDFSRPYFVNADVMMVRRDPGSAAATDPATPRLATVDDLRDKRIGVQLGTVYDGYATAHFPKATILQYQSFPDMTLAISTGKIDAAFADIDTLRELMRENDRIGILGKPLFTSPVAAGFNQRNTQTKDDFNRFLADLRQNGQHADMTKRWMDKRETRMPEIPTAKTGEALKVGISSGSLPFAAFQDQQLVGFDIELARRFAAALNRPIEFSDMPFGGLVAAVASGKVDMSVADMFITEERKKSISFSDPYFEQDSLVFTLKSNLIGGTESSTRRPVPPFFARLKQSFVQNIVDENRYLILWDGLKTTIIISILSTLSGTLLAAGVCAMRMSASPLLRLPAVLFISLLRGTPIVVLLMIIFYVVFASIDISPILVATVAFGMHFGAYAAEIFRSGIEGIESGQTEAGISMGFTRLQTFRFIIMPQMIRRILPIYKGEFISLVKMTSVVGYIAVQDLTKASDIIRSRTFDAFFPLVMIAVLYFLIAWIFTQGLDYLERASDPRTRLNAGETS